MSLELTKAMSKEETNKLQEMATEHMYYGLQYRQQWLDRFVSSLKFYFNKQLTDYEQKLLDLRGQERFITNHLRPNLKSLQAFLTANKPSWNVIAINSDDTFARQLYNGMLTYIWDISYAYHKIYRITRNMLVGGSGRAMPVIDYRMRKGLGDVKLKDVPPENFVGDWNSREIDESDARFQALTTMDYVSIAMGIRPDLRTEIETFEMGFDGELTIIDESDVRFGKINPSSGLNTALVRYVEYYRLVDKKLWNIVDRTTGLSFPTLNEPDIVLPSHYDVKDRSELSLEKYLCLYDGVRTLILDKEEYPIPMYIIPQFSNEDTDNLFPLGETYFVMDLLRWINKSYQHMMYHAQISSNPVTYVPYGSGDVNEMEMKGSIPGAHIEFDPAKGSPIFKDAAPLNNAWYGLAKELVDQLKHHMGTFGAFTGDPGAMTGNASEYLMAQERGSDRAKVIFRNFEVGLEMSGKATAALARYHYDFPMWLNWTDERNRNKGLFINGVTIDDNGGVESLYLKDFDVDLKLVTSSYMPTNGVAHTQTIKELYAIAPEYAKHSLFVKMLQYLQLDQDLIDEIDQLGELIPNLLTQLQAAAGENEELQKLVDGMKKLLMTADRRAVKAEYDAALKGQLSKQRADLQVASEKLKLEEEKDKLDEKDNKAKGRQ
jgi:hypothetical protein